MAKPDNRADNVEHLQESINNTIKNHDEAEEYLAEHADEISPEERQTIQEKNERREKSLQGLRSEIQDEAANQQDQ
ncbi:MAG: small acid-soluble spore protein Tlp [Paenibacillus sp.]|nr:small acid-soluble spore protein Tlp [Paenibacillus sp.]